MNFSDITIVNIDGRSGNRLGGQYAIAQSQRELPGAKGLLLTPERPDMLLDGIEHIPIQPLGYFEYGLFVIYALHELIRTEFALIVQDDGWVLSGQNWRDEFFNFDIIGAPIHLARVTQGGQVRHVRRFKWVGLLSDPSVKVEIVLNGGFSLRSRKFLQAPTHHGISYVLPPPLGLSGPQWKMSWESDSHLEDVHLCLDMRAALQGHGLRYAPPEVARRFAFEHLCPGLHDNFDLKSVLGHHSTIRKLSSIDPLRLAYQYSLPQMERGFYYEDRVVEVLRHYGYGVSFP